MPQVINEVVAAKIDELILAWEMEWKDIASQLGIPIAAVGDRYEKRFAIPVRRMIDAGATNEEIARTTGLPASPIAAFRAAKARQQGQQAAEDAANIEASLSLEQDLQRALRKKIQSLEPGLTIIDEGRERSTEAGRIDILAKDRNDARVVIELKLGEADKSAVGQILAYMGSLKDEAPGEVRGILVAESFDVKALKATKLVPSLKLMSYEVQFTFKIPG